MKTRIPLCGAVGPTLLPALLAVCGVAFGYFGIQPARGQDFVVNSIKDLPDNTPGDGACISEFDPTPRCSLRAAIQEANALGGTHNISFNFGAGVPSLTPTSGLPFITTPVIINGATGGSTRIEIRGDFAGNAYGLVLGTGSDGSKLSSLVIRNFAIDGLVVASKVTVQNCYIGTDATGAVKQANGNDGIRIDGSNNVIGGTTAGTGNVISGNTHYGVHLILSASGNQIQGNRIGVNAAGTAALGNLSGGVYLDCSPGNAITNNIIGGTTAAVRNIISGNGGNAGVAIAGSGAAGNKVQGNYVGTDINGTVALGNANAGISLENVTTNNSVGGTAAGAGNLISGNGQWGVFVINGANGNLVQGNFIGTDSSGTKPLGNKSHGIWIDGLRGTDSNNIIGGAGVGAGNVVSANGGNGVQINLTGAHDNIVQGNLIGTDVTGTANLGNAGNGIFISSLNNTIGGIGLGNTIAFNADRGITMSGGSGNGVSGNSIFSNGSLGIDLNSDGVTPNDAGDTDSGPNNLQNFPVLNSASYNSSTNATIVQGTLNSTANTAFTIEFFSSPAADPSGYGEGQTFRGSTRVTTDASGNVSFGVALNAPVPGGQLLTATATDPTNNTSEFSQAMTVIASTPTPTPTPPSTARALNISTRMLVQSGDNALIAGFILTGSDQKTVAVRGIGPSLSQFFTNPLIDPTLELHSGSVTLTTNDNWQDDPTVAPQLSAQNLAPTDPRESGIVASLQSPAAYTAILSGKGGDTGIGVVEVYDLNQSANSQLANISTRGFVLTDNNVMIGGIILGGSPNSTRVAIRGIGPSLAQFGLDPVLADPTLELHDGNGMTLATNDNWQDDSTQAAQLTANGLAPSDPKEAAIFAMLPPGQFTAILAGKDGGTGIGVVEAYNVH